MGGHTQRRLTACVAKPDLVDDGYCRTAATVAATLTAVGTAKLESSKPSADAAGGGHETQPVSGGRCVVFDGGACCVSTDTDRNTNDADTCRHTVVRETQIVLG